MGRFTSLTEKVYKIATKQEALVQFPELSDVIEQTHPDSVYLTVHDQRPAPKPVPPQLLGPYPDRTSAEDAIKEVTDQYRAALNYTESNVVQFEDILINKEKGGK